ncbi:hypothetical protein C8246_20515 [Paracidovorax avenae]|uniref:Uncharacterized protein n=1 Tax=Paracidovorax avenae (strain ATCC 19860 / DSM 7227 / CCUG 15838 / JCM 20985 / LMG 2117 / NCPPB 1011) TaxID=643561 RepID=F0Q0Y0_PARA1|nr:MULTISPECIES: hypothetical protein [Comamonadaceae]ADX47647.1 hypothetical protein Acav_3756 [Paracidovorax avenae ATCC 19860]AVS63192.1 hypothetical protein C8241_17270 [Paracidovorax avenae]AVS66177.1 hypothetical protein C8245_11260 [Paracidovorax avenae]AVS71652.1 hypothetical protein C8247_15305 [Paracidovorax avenae]AVS82315.1 hypothetical protein C8237_15350 [Paracidovorax avenae]
MRSPHQPAAADNGAATFQSPPLDTHDFIRAAARALGMDNAGIDRAAEDGGCAIGDLLITVAPLSPPPGRQDAMPRPEVQVMLTVVMRQRFSDMPAQDASALLANAPGLLAGFDAAIGCLPEGEATLHRRVTLPAGDAEGQALAGEMVATARLATLVFSPGIAGG